MVCAQHHQGLTWLNKVDGKLFSLKNGLFGTMPVGLTGVTDFKNSWPAWLRKSAELTLPGRWLCILYNFTVWFNLLENDQCLLKLTDKKQCLSN